MRAGWHTDGATVARACNDSDKTVDQFAGLSARRPSNVTEVDVRRRVTAGTNVVAFDRAHGFIGQPSQ